MVMDEVSWANRNKQARAVGGQGRVRPLTPLLTQSYFRLCGAVVVQRRKL